MGCFPWGTQTSSLVSSVAGCHNQAPKLIGPTCLFVLPTRALPYASSTISRRSLQRYGWIGNRRIDARPNANGRAKSTILFFLSGGASHVDMWDMKPEAPLEYRGPFQPIATSAPGIRLCEHLPLLARQAHHLALINSVGASCEHERSSCRLFTTT